MIAFNSNAFLFLDLCRLNFSTAFSTNAVSICHSVGLPFVTRVEVSRRYLVTFGDTIASGGDSGRTITSDVEDALAATLFDRMTECRYASPITTFDLDIQPDAVYEVDIMGRGKEALEKANQELGKWFAEFRRTRKGTDCFFKSQECYYFCHFRLF